MEKETLDEQMKVVSFRLPVSQFNAFKAMADFFGVPLSQLFRDMISIGLDIAKVKDGGKDDE